MSQQQQQSSASLWNHEVQDILNRAEGQSMDHYTMNPTIRDTKEYLQSIKVFKSDDDAAAAKQIIADFNDRALDDTNTNPHPPLSDTDAATLMRLGVFSANDAVFILPHLSHTFKDHLGSLQHLLQMLSKYSTQTMY